MAQNQARSKRKASGGKYMRRAFKKKKHSLGNIPTLTKLGDRSIGVRRVLGGNRKFRTIISDTVNLLGTDGKATKAKIKTIKESPANRHFVRRNIITKGTIIETDKGLVKVTNRPGQEGSINAVLVK